MHSFDELVDRSINFSLNNLKNLEEEIFAELESSSATHLIKNLQMITMQRVIMAVGIMSIFEANLQDQLDCTNGFVKARELLKSANELSLEKRFEQFIAAINVLKHGRGRSYDFLQSNMDSLPFRLKKADENFFFEGDVSEISILVEVDYEFVLNCARLIQDISYIIPRPKS